MKKPISMRIHHDPWSHSQVNIDSLSAKIILKWALEFVECYEDEYLVEMSEDGIRAKRTIEKIMKMFELESSGV